MNLFKGLIKCTMCNRNYNYRKDHNSHIYLCSGTKNYGVSFCPRRVVYEGKLIELISNHCQIKKKPLDISKHGIKKVVKRIEVGYDTLKILYWDGDESVFSPDKLKF